MADVVPCLDLLQFPYIRWLDAAPGGSCGAALGSALGFVSLSIHPLVGSTPDS